MKYAQIYMIESFFRENKLVDTTKCHRTSEEGAKIYIGITKKKLIDSIQSSSKMN